MFINLTKLIAQSRQNFNITLSSIGYYLNITTYIKNNNKKGITLYPLYAAPSVGQTFKHNTDLQATILDCLNQYLQTHAALPTKEQSEINRYIQKLAKQVEQTKMESTLVAMVLVKTTSSFWRNNETLRSLADVLRFKCHVRRPDGVYDVRGNGHVFTLRESEWSVKMFPALQSHHLSLIKRATKLLTPEEFADDIMALFRYHDETKGDLEMRVSRAIRPENARTIKPKNFSELKKYNLRTLYNYLRDQECFLYRGRIEVSEETRLERAASATNLLAGITEAQIAHQHPSLNKAFVEPHYHAKNDYTRQGLHDDDTDEFFRKRNIPFITGASGTLAYVLALYLQANLFSKHELEIFVLFHAASLIYLGHHSLLELIIVAQSVFLFDGLPSIADSIEHPGFYQEFIRQFSSYIRRYNMPGVG